MGDILREAFDRRYVLLPLLLAIALVIAGFFVAEARRDYTRDLSEVISEREESLRTIAELTYATMDAESAQRGYVITGNREYLDGYEPRQQTALELVDRLIQHYKAKESDEVAVLERVRATLLSKFGEQDDAIRQMEEGKARSAVATVKTDVGLYFMRDIREQLEGLRGRELERLYATLVQWKDGIRLNTYINLATTAFTIVLLALVGWLATREIRRRDATSTELEGLVNQRTAELRELSTHMLRIGEIEKAALARELHDELGGLLVAMRMDLAQLRRRITLPDADAETRWKRIDSAITAGVELKRRVIEDLRPTLLDNMGLITALRWQAEQSCSQAGLRLKLDVPEQEPALGNDTAIAIFRCVQELLFNVLKHAKATQVTLALRAAERLTVVVEDDGIGMPDRAVQSNGTHGLKQIHFRMQAVGGEVRTEAVVPHGTRTMLAVPL
jgi:signal transduction histidine kinase